MQQLLRAIALTFCFAMAGCSTKGTDDTYKSGNNDTTPVGKVEVTVTTPFGSDSAALGHDIPEEGAPEGPEAFVVDDDGTIFVLDQLNSRIQSFKNKKHTGTIPLPRATFDDLDFWGDDGFVLLDKYSQKSLVFIAKDGQVQNEVVIEGDGIVEVSMITAIFSRKDGVWVENNDAEMVRIALASGDGDPDRPAVAGRWENSGKAILRQVVDPRAGTLVVYRQPSDAQAAVLAEPKFTGHVFEATELESDGEGRIWMTVLTGDLDALEDPENPGPDAFQLFLLTMDSAGTELGRQAMPLSDGPELISRPFRIGRDGLAYLMRTTEEGVEITKVTP